MDGVHLSTKDEAPPPSGFGAQAGVVVGDRWILREELGRGASSVVWRATHELLGKDVAIKFLDPSVVRSSGSTQENVLERFRFEAQVSSTLATKTAEIIAVHDAGAFWDTPFIVMDLVRGESVASLIERDALPLELVARMVRDVATALDACHSLGIAHRDTKPANIMLVSATSMFKLTDFGLAKHFGPVPAGAFVPRNTEGAMLVGTPAYMGPEAISADRTACGRGDVWSLAVTLYECLMRKLPFDGEAWPAVAVAIMNRSYVKPSAHDPDLARFDAFFDEAFAEEIDDRFQSGGKLAEAFERAAFPAVTPREAVASREAVAPREAVALVGEAKELVSGDRHPPQPTVVDVEPAPPPPMRRSFVLPAVAAMVVGASAIGGLLVFTPREEAAPTDGPPLHASAPVAATIDPRASADAASTTSAAAPIAPNQLPMGSPLGSPTSAPTNAASSPPKTRTSNVRSTAAVTPPTTTTPEPPVNVPAKPRSKSEVW